MQEGRFIEREVRELLSFLVRERDDVVVKAGDLHAALFIVQRARSFAQSALAGLATAPPNTPLCRSCFGPRSVISQARMPRKPYVIAGMPGAYWLVSLMTATSQASCSAVRFEEIVEVVAADFFFAFDDELHVDGQPAVRLQPGFDRFDVREHLPFVVGRAAGVDVAVANRRLERRGHPFSSSGSGGCTS